MEATMSNAWARMAQTETYGGVTTTFTGDFNIAEPLGLDAVKDTFERAFNEFKNDIRYFTNLGMVCNHKSWEQDAKGNRELSDFYAEAWYRVYDAVYADDSSFSTDDMKYFFNITD